MMSTANDAANATKPRMSVMSSSNVFGTSSDTTSSVIAKPKTASLNPSRRETSRLRMRNPLPSTSSDVISAVRSIAVWLSVLRFPIPRQSDCELPELLRPRATGEDLRPVPHLDLHPAPIERHELPNEVEVHDVRAVHADEPFGIEAPLEVVQREVHEIRPRLRVHLHVVVRRLDRKSVV